MKRVLFSLLLLSSAASFAALPPARFIASELAKNSGAGIYQIEQDVQFATAGEPLVLRETWWIESDRTMRLQVTGTRELKDQFRLQYVYLNGQRVGLSAQGKSTKKESDDFIEKYFHYRNPERFLKDLVAMKIIPAAILARKTFRTVKEIEYKPETNVRLGRSGGAIAYAFGAPSPVEGEASPGFWIEQDAFVLRKFRLPSFVEVVADKFIQSPRGLLFPRVRTVRWGSNTVQIQTLTVSARTDLKREFFQPSSLEAVNRMDGIENPSLKSLVEEFYSRFR
jgi:hypothetical protein